MTDRHAAPDVASAQITGARDSQEDTLMTRVLAADSGVHAGELLLVLADGMGGHASGEVASRLVVDQFSSSYVNGPANVQAALRDSLHIANEQLAIAMDETPGCAGMGTTLIGSVLRDHRLYWISVGDSPLWLYRDAALQRLNADHSMAPLLDDMARNGLMDREDALADFRRNKLRSAVAGMAIELVDVCTEPCVLQAGDIAVLASDGVLTLSAGQLVTVLQNPHDRSLQELADDMMTLIDAAGHRGQDNASVILYRH